MKLLQNSLEGDGSVFAVHYGLVAELCQEADAGEWQAIGDEDLNILHHALHGSDGQGCGHLNNLTICNSGWRDAAHYESKLFGDLWCNLKIAGEAGILNYRRGLNCSPLADNDSYERCVLNEYPPDHLPLLICFKKRSGHSLGNLEPDLDHIEHFVRVTLSG